MRGRALRPALLLLLFLNRSLDSRFTCIICLVLATSCINHHCFILLCLLWFLIGNLTIDCLGDRNLFFSRTDGL